MPSSRPLSLSESIRLGELENKLRNEQQKTLLLNEVAHLEADLHSRKICEESRHLRQESRTLVAHAKELRSESARWHRHLGCVVHG